MLHQKKLWVGHESAQTGGQTDRRRERVIPIYPFVHGGYKNVLQKIWLIGGEI